MHSGNRPGTVWEPWYGRMLWTLFPHRVLIWRLVSWPRGNCSAPKFLAFRSAVVAEAAKGWIVSGIDPKVPCANEAPGNSWKLLHLCISNESKAFAWTRSNSECFRFVQHRFIDYRSSTGSLLLPALSSHPAFPAPKALNPKDSPESTGGACFNTAHVRHFLNVKTVRIPSDEFKEPKKAELWGNLWKPMETYGSTIEALYKYQTEGSLAFICLGHFFAMRPEAWRNGT